MIKLSFNTILSESQGTNGQLPTNGFSIQTIIPVEIIHYQRKLLIKT